MTGVRSIPPSCFLVKSVQGSARCMLLRCALLPLLPARCSSANALPQESKLVLSLPHVYCMVSPPCPLPCPPLSLTPDCSASMLGATSAVSTA
eukprot:760272-Hanusia_phi.AAC.2